MIIEWECDTAAPADLPFSLVGDCCLTAEGVALPCAVHVLMTNDDAIHQINREQRGVDSATDVLSFPMVGYRPGKTAGQSEQRLRREWNPDLHACMLGDIVISADHAKAQALAYGHSVGREMSYLFAHALFHLMGYDHLREEDQRLMREKEEQALTMAGISREEQTPQTPDDQLLALAHRAMANSYSPYSHYAVGAALLCADGRVFTGCNIENASFGATNCAERTALFKAISEGARAFAAIAITSSGSTPYPCGLCRQALNEFAPELRVLAQGADGRREETTLNALLPHGFGPKDVL